MFFQNWTGLLRVVVVGTLAYIALVLLLRISGKRTLSKMNAFDLVVTISLGSTLATVLLSKDVSLAEGVLALALLIALQYVVAWLSVHSSTVRRLVKAEPTLLFFRGQFLEDAMRRERIVQSEVWSAVRAQGVPSLENVEAVVLETDGSVTVIHQLESHTASALQGVRNYPPEAVK